MLVDGAVQVASGAVLHDVVHVAFIVGHVQEADHVRVAGHGVVQIRLALLAVGLMRLGCGSGNDLDCAVDVAVRVRDAFAATIDDAEATAAELVD